MGKIKLNSSVKMVMNKYNSKAKKINDNYVTPDRRDNSGLKALNKFISEEKNIKKLLDSYMGLVQKDVKDMNSMIEYYEKTDKSLSPNMCPVKKTVSKKKHSFNEGGAGSW